MIIQLKKEITENDKIQLFETLDNLQIEHCSVKTQKAAYQICIPKREFDIRKIGHLKGIADVHRVSGKHKMVSQKWKVEKSEINIDKDLKIGNGNFQLMAGPCSIESEEQIQNTIECLLNNNVKIMRGGVYKPRTSPYSHRGLGMEGLLMFYKACNENNIKIITEVMEASQIEKMMPYVDIFQVGARNSQNFNLLDALGEIDKPVMIKRGISGSIDELLFSAEYVFKNGNENLLLCERGIRTFENSYRNTLDLNAVAILQEKTHLPVIVDPSHGIGIRKHVFQMTLASVASGADGIIIEIHKTPNRALTDGQQTIDFNEFGRLVNKIDQLLKVL